MRIAIPGGSVSLQTAVGAYIAAVKSIDPDAIMAPGMLVVYPGAESTTRRFNHYDQCCRSLSRTLPPNFYEVSKLTWGATKPHLL